MLAYNSSCLRDVNSDDVSQAVAVVDAPREDTVGQAAGRRGEDFCNQTAGDWTADRFACFQYN